MRPKGRMYVFKLNLWLFYFFEHIFHLYLKILKQCCLEHILFCVYNAAAKLPSLKVFVTY